MLDAYTLCWAVQHYMLLQSPAVAHTITSLVLPLCRHLALYVTVCCLLQLLSMCCLHSLQVLGSNYKSELLAVIAPENLPVQFGGLSPCTDMVDVGPWQDPAIISQCPALRKAAAAGQLHGIVMRGDSSSDLQRGSSSLIGAGSAASGDGGSESSGEEVCGADALVSVEGLAIA